jgi:uncharacterized repeat protein (TIGR03803 family)
MRGANFHFIHRLALAAITFSLAVCAQGQTFKTLANFGSAGASPGPVVQGFNGDFYGTTPTGGEHGYGAVFEVTPQGELSGLYNFCSQADCADGEFPWGLVQATDGNLYGTTLGTNSGPYGTVFKVTPTGALSTLHTFCSRTNCADGQNPYGGLIQASNGNFYGITFSGGASLDVSSCHYMGCGVLFEVTAAGELTVLYNFCSQANCVDGANPISTLVQGTNGNFYGVTFAGGAADAGTVFEMTRAGKLTTLYSFCARTSWCPDGLEPNGLVQGGNGNLYGTTVLGGATGYNNGTFFEINAAEKFSSLYSFCADGVCSEGANPNSGLVQGANGKFYGTTNCGGLSNSCGDFSYGPGTVFEISSSGKLTTIHDFCSETNCDDGQGPVAGPVQGTSGKIYGTTTFGGAYDDGTFFSLALGLEPFVETLPTAGEVGVKVIILGNNLAGTTGVSFDGAAATFTVVSNTEITATVPAGATTGVVSVVTASGTLNSNPRFVVSK